MKIYFYLFVAIFSVGILSAQNIVFADPEFKAMLLSSDPSNSVASNLVGLETKIDANNDGEIQESEALDISKLNVGSDLISDYLGISFFTNLKSLEINESNVTSIDLSSNTALAFLYCNDTKLEMLDLSENIALIALQCSNSELFNLNLSQNVNLKVLECDNNNLSSLNVTFNTALDNLKCNNNSIMVLDVSQNLSLINLYCQNNLLANLDTSSNSELTSLNCNSNVLTHLFLKKGTDWFNLFFSNNPTLQYVCTNESQIDFILAKVILYGYTNCEVNSYCNFVPGGFYYEIYGETLLDSNNNGCDFNDTSIPFLKYNISDATNSRTLIGDSTGDFIFAAKEGTYNIAPILENPTYFNISPTIVSVSLPSSTTPAIQNFCITPNGTHQDLEVVIIPIELANPGFNVRYKIGFKNKGTQPQSGTLNLAFDNTVLSFMSANLNTSSQLENNLNWNFSNLSPFENREIEVTFYLNSAIETPAVNVGYILNFTATIAGATDETPLDNISNLNQSVTSATVTNDKICIEGGSITQSQVGNEIHYMIRFENNENLVVKNIVVKDMIDTAKFDINSLTPIDGSHLFETRISNNKVEFIFENINLPFDNANNDGFVSFKIKTKPTLVLGDTFGNIASIYFDYDAPIQTNLSETNVVAALGTRDFEFSRYFSISPNPASDDLILHGISNNVISSLQIYNMLGQIVLSLPNGNNFKTIDVSQLQAGNYIIKLHSDKGLSSCKFVKR